MAERPISITGGGEMKAPLFSILHTSARPDKWRAVYDDWMAKAVHPEDVEYVLCVDPRWGFEMDPAKYATPLDNVHVVVNNLRRCYVDGVNIAAKASTGLRLNLGCSDAHMPGWRNVDLCAPADEIADLSLPWPWPDSSVVAIKAWDVLEHIESKLHTMNEAHRVLVPGGQLDLFIPTTDGRGAFQDPTHKSFWTPNDLFYYCEEYAEWERFHRLQPEKFKAHFRIVNQSHMEYPSRVWKLRAILEAVK